MQWGHIKTLFILSFLILNIYLVSAFIDRQQDVSYLDNQELPIEDQLAAEKITYGDINVDVTESTYISVIRKLLTSKEIELLNGKEDQTIEVIDKNMIAAALEKPVSIPKNANREIIEELIQEKVLYGNEYFLWNWNEELNLLVFFQKKEGQDIYYNENGLLLVYLNDNNEITHYTQTILGESEVQGDLVALNQPTQVIGILYKGNYLNRGDEITHVEPGYYSRIATEGGIQVFAPTWKVTVNDERNHFVNAIEGIVYENDELEFLQNVMIDNKGRLTSLDDENELRNSMIQELDKRLEIDTRLEIDNRSETE
ncbi:two-component system regulatory protein YycI [Oceanobacillus sp. FSL H7-0719]|uniref:two-component system regulatory protein YycI n=1 Tax=Oceanobacillus sp. FSL H7-0719 TaxID=2954507 RepID=UPI00324AB4E2